MQFNSREIQPQFTPSNQSVIAQLTGQFGDSLKGMGSSMKNIGQGLRSNRVSELIGSGALKDMSEQDARIAIENASKGSVNEQTVKNIGQLLGGKKSSEEAKAIAEVKVIAQDKDLSMQELLTGRRLESSESIADKNRKNQVALTKEKGLQQSSNRALNEIFQREQLKTTQDNTKENIKLRALLNPKADKDVFGNIIEKSVGDEFVNNPKFVPERTAKVVGVLDNDNMFWDAEYDNEVTKSIIDEIIYQGTDTKDGRKALGSKSSEATYSYVDKQLAKRGLAIDEGMFGNISIRKMTQDEIKQYKDTNKLLNRIE